MAGKPTCRSNTRLCNVVVGKVTEQNWEDILRQNYIVLSRIRPGYIVDILFQECVLNEDDRDEIRSLPTPRRQATHLLDLLPSKGYKSFVSFLSMLENEYPEIYQTVTGKEAVTKPGYVPMDRWSAFLEQMPAVFSKLTAEITHSKTLDHSLQQVKQTIDFMKEEKLELEKELEMYRVELTDLPQLKRDLQVLAQENENLKYENHDRTKEVLVRINEKDQAERNCRELKCALQKLKSEVETVTMERDKEKRKTQKLEKTVRAKNSSFDAESIPIGSNQNCADNVRAQLENDIMILRENERELQENNDELGQTLLKIRTDLHQAEDDLRKATIERDKSLDALKNAEENFENLQARCEGIWKEVDQLRQEKDKAIQSQHSYLDMYNSLSMERDRLSTQLRKVESQYDATKKQLDKLKQDMRSSLKSSCDGLDFNSTIHQWINRLEEQRIFGSGTSSSELSDQQSPAVLSSDPLTNRKDSKESLEMILTIPTLNHSLATLERSDTVSAVMGEPSSDPHDSGRNVLIRRKDQYDTCTRVPGRRGFVTGSNAGQDDGDTDNDVYAKVYDPCAVFKTDGAGTKFYIRCGHAYTGETDKELSYSTGDILLVTDTTGADRKDWWWASKVDLDTGSPCGPHQTGLIKASAEKYMHQDRRKAWVENSLSRRPAIRKTKSEDRDVANYTLMTMVKVPYKRPILFTGDRDVTKAVSRLMSGCQNFESWDLDDAQAKDFEKKLLSVPQKDAHVILPSGCLQLCQLVKVYPICIDIKIGNEDADIQHLASLFGEVKKEWPCGDAKRDLEEVKTVSANHETFMISASLVPTCEDLVRRMAAMVSRAQKNVAWTVACSQKPACLISCSSP